MKHNYLLEILIAIFVAIIFRRIFYKKNDREFNDYLGVSIFAIAIYIIYILIRLTLN